MASAVRVSRGASYLTIQTIITSLAQLLSFAVLTRIITPADVGILAILSLITGLSQAINGTVFQQASMKYIGEYADSSVSSAAGVFNQSFRVSVIVSLPIAVFIFVASGFLAHALLGTVSQAQLFKVLAGDVLIYAGALPVANGAVLGAKRFKESATIGTVGAVLRQCLIILLILFLKSFVGLVYAWVLSDFAMLIGFGFYAVHVLGLPTRPFPFRKLMDFSWPLTIGNLVSFAYNSFDRAILVAAVPLASLGVYNAALYAYGVLTAVSSALGNVLLPVYSSIGSSGFDAYRKATWLVSRYLSLIMTPLAFGLFATATPALTLFVGRAYVTGAVPLMMLSLSVAFTAFGLGFSPLLTALAKTRTVSLITILSTILALISAYALLPFMGITGAAVARGVAALASLALTIYALKHIPVHAPSIVQSRSPRSELNILNIDGEMVWKTMMAGAVMACVLIAAQAVVYSRLLLPLYVLVGAIVYLISLRALNAVREHDVELIEKYLGSRLGFVARLLRAVLLSKD
jgi:O-antigen/teichoic acid export membrane protein